MSIHSEINLQVNQILLDPVNPRHEPIQSQVEQIKAMIDNQPLKLVKLAEDIVASGLNPSDRITVIPHPDEKNKYIVVEGNRRITALKLLNSPSLCHVALLRSKFENLNKVYVKNPIPEIKCVMYSDRDSAGHWISLKHTGENSGIGTVGWNTVEIRRYQAQGQDKKESSGLQLMNFVLKNLELDETAIKLIKKTPITTIERAIGDPDIRKHLGLSFENGVLKSLLSAECAAQKYYEFIIPFASREKRVTAVYHKEDREKYLKDLGASPTSTPSNLSKGSWDLNSPPKSNPQKAPKTPAEKSPRSKPSSTARKFLIPSDCVIKISSPRINDIYKELKNELIVSEVPNACAVLLRVFLEISIDNYNKSKNVGCNDNDKLHQKISKTAQFMEDNRILDKSVLKPVRKAASVPDGLFSTNTLNAYVHNPNIHPRHEELKMTWNEMELFIKKIWG